MNLQAGGYTLENLDKINIIVGKNGYGKSRILRAISQNRETLLVNNVHEELGFVQPITPERGGYLQDDPNIELNLANNSNYEKDTRIRNQTGNFRQQSMAKFRTLETLSLRKMETEFEETGTVSTENTFKSIVEKINLLLDNIEIRREGMSFKIYNKYTESILTSEDISSGESELISLAIEILSFEKHCDPLKKNILCLDEPDLHLHPDLQYKFAQLLISISNENTIVILSSHNTPIIGALTEFEGTRIGFIKSPQDSSLLFQSPSEELSQILPIFGAHPLTNVYKKTPILLVEGEDDSRIWNTAYRKSSGKVNVYPCVTGSITKLNSYENKANDILNTIYDNGLGYSLRDRDDAPESDELEDKERIVRLRTSCRTAENLLLTDESLAVMRIDWGHLATKIDEWISQNINHPHYNKMKEFKDSGFPRKTFNLKDLRNDIISICASKKDWETIVGIAISKLTWDDSTNFEIENSMFNYLGVKTVKNLLPKNPSPTPQPGVQQP